MKVSVSFGYFFVSRETDSSINHNSYLFVIQLYSKHNMCITHKPVTSHKRTRIKNISLFLVRCNRLCVMHILCFEYSNIYIYIHLHLSTFAIVCLVAFLFVAIFSFGFSEKLHIPGTGCPPGRGWNIKAHQCPSLHLPTKVGTVFEGGAMI